MRRWSISLRLTLWFGGIFFLGWLLFGAAMWFNLKSTLTGERHQTLSRRVDRLQDLLRNNQNENEEDRQQDFHEFAHATGNGLNEVFRMDGGRDYPSPSSAARVFPWPAVKSDNAERFLQIDSAGQAYWVLVPAVLSRQSISLSDVGSPRSGKSAGAQPFSSRIARLSANPLTGLIGGRLLGWTKGTYTGGPNYVCGSVHQYKKSL